MATYIPAYKGYIADVPLVWFKRCDKRVFYFDEITAASITPETNFTEVNAGWSLYPVAYLPGQSTLEAQMTSGQFNADLFAMANNRTFAEDATYKTFYTESLVPDTNHKVTLSKTPVADSVSIAGMTEGETAAAGVFVVATADNVTTVTFAADDVDPDTAVEISYEAIVEGAKVIEVDNKTAAVGEAVFKWPVYAGSDDCSDSAIKGYVVMKIYRCRVTAMPGFDTSYKEAATNQVTWSALDAKRADGSVYSMAYMPKEDASGE